ncbi:MAG: CRISPR-associated endonuclease Cas1 [Polyangiaceae bacterium]|nr:CRISPR-associated endonuclease Cas1 [Polyangiaceae bacterium]
MFRTVVVHERGTYLGKRGERLVIRRPTKSTPSSKANATEAPAAADGKIQPDGKNQADGKNQPDGQNVHNVRPSRSARDEEEIPFFRIGEIVLPPRAASLSTDVIEEAALRGIPITFVNPAGQPYAMLTSPMFTATVLTRRAQLRAMERKEGAELCRSFVTGKLRNQASLLAYFSKSEKSDKPRRERVLQAAADVRKARKSALAVEGTCPDAVRDTLMGTEGAGAKAYWSGVKALLEGRCDFQGRKGRGAVDPVNAMLNYGYGILSSRCWAALLHAGLDPFAGMLHADRSGKPSLVLDLMEELRAPAVDRAVIAHVRLGQPVRFEGNFLDDSTRKAIAAAVLERLESPVMIAGKKYQLGSVVQRQARAVANHVRGEEPYKPFAMTW